MHFAVCHLLLTPFPLLLRFVHFFGVQNERTDNNKLQWEYRVQWQQQNLLLPLLLLFAFALFGFTDIPTSHSTILFSILNTHINNIHKHVAHAHIHKHLHQRFIYLWTNTLTQARSNRWFLAIRCSLEVAYRLNIQICFRFMDVFNLFEIITLWSIDTLPTDTTPIAFRYRKFCTSLMTAVKGH